MISSGRSSGTPKNNQEKKSSDAHLFHHKKSVKRMATISENQYSHELEEKMKMHNPHMISNGWVLRGHECDRYKTEAKKIIISSESKDDTYLHPDSLRFDNSMRLEVGFNIGLPNE